MSTPISDRPAERPIRLPGVFALVILTAVTLLASGCGSPKIMRPANPVASMTPTPQLGARLRAEGDTAQAALVYSQLASSEQDPIRRLDYQLLASELFFDSERYEDGARILATLPDAMPNDEMQLRRNIVEAYAALAENDPQRAIQSLPQPRSLSDRSMRIRALEIQARAAQLTGDSAQALKTRIVIESSLNTPDSINRNRESIWKMLNALDQPTLQSMMRTPGGSIYRGWLEYVLLTRASETTNPEIQSKRTRTWQSRFPDHPAARAVLQGSEAEMTPGFADAMAISGDQIALLLPLSGQFSEVGEAIKTGFIAARFQSANSGYAPNVKVYDSGSQLDRTIEQYEIAIAEGASMIIGPLNKAAVINLAASNRIVVPTLSLNYLGDDMPGNSNLYQFGLLPEDEARDVANFVKAQNLEKALVVAADTAIGERLAKAFTDAFTLAGGKVLATELVSEDAYDYSPQLKKLLDINNSNSRKRQLQKVLDTTVEFEPGIRGDAEIVFMAVNAEHARLLRPQLQFHHASKLPLYSTSQIYSGSQNARADGDLSGVRYCDIPWILTDATQQTPLFQMISNSQNHNPDYTRLYALGMDAYMLHSELDNMRLNPQHSVSGKTGDLSLAIGNRIRRRLQWAEFQKGLPVKISEALAIETTLPPLTNEL